MEKLTQGVYYFLESCIFLRAFPESPYTYDFGVINLVGISGELLDENLTLTVHDAYRWVRIEDLPDYSFPPADLPLIEHIKNLR
jgi:8-oxo-dGTP diphosphatase